MITFEMFLRAVAIVPAIATMITIIMWLQDRYKVKYSNKTPATGEEIVETWVVIAVVIFAIITCVTLALWGLGY